MTILSGPTQTKARKRHKCDYCQYPINTGDTYKMSTHTFEGDKHNMFEECDEAVTSDDFIEYIMHEYNDNIDGPKLPRGTEFKDYLDFVLSHHLHEAPINEK